MVLKANRPEAERSGWNNYKRTPPPRPPPPKMGFPSQPVEAGPSHQFDESRHSRRLHRSGPPQPSPNRHNPNEQRYLDRWTNFRRKMNNGLIEMISNKKIKKQIMNGAIPFFRVDKKTCKYALDHATNEFRQGRKDRNLPAETFIEFGIPRAKLKDDDIPDGSIIVSYGAELNGPHMKLHRSYGFDTWEDDIDEVTRVGTPVVVPREDQHIRVGRNHSFRQPSTDASLSNAYPHRYSKDNQGRHHDAPVVPPRRYSYAQSQTSGYDFERLSAYRAGIIHHPTGITLPAGSKTRQIHGAKENTSRYLPDRDDNTSVVSAARSRNISGDSTTPRFSRQNYDSALSGRRYVKRSQDATARYRESKHGAVDRVLTQRSWQSHRRDVDELPWSHGGSHRRDVDELPWSHGGISDVDTITSPRDFIIRNPKTSIIMMGDVGLANDETQPQFMY